MTNLPRGTWGQRGRWHGAIGLTDPWVKPAPMHYRLAIMCCPACGFDVSLSRHTVQADGTITPSVVCPITGKHDPIGVLCPCGFHDNVKLLGWPEWKEEILVSDKIYSEFGVA